jgi:hypothetical protein
MKPRCTNAVCLAVLDKLLEFGDLAAPFVDPVDQILYPDYMRLVTTPMDLGTVRKLLLSDPSYAGDRFAEGVRQCFGNALFFNSPKEPIHVAASTLLSLFEKEWRKFDDVPSELPLGPPQPLTLKRPSELGKVVLTLRTSTGGIGGKKRPTLDESAVAQQEKFLAHRARAEAIMSFSERLMAGSSLKKATAETMPRWAIIAENLGASTFSSLAIESDVRTLISALEDTQSAGKVSKWLKVCLSGLDDKSKSDFLLYRLMAQLGVEETPFVDVFVLMQSPELLGRMRLWNVMFSSLARSGCQSRIIQVLQKLVLGPAAQFKLLLAELKGQSQDAIVLEALDQFGKWLLVELKPSRTDLLAMTCTGFPRLRQSMGKLALEVIAQVPEVESLSDLIRLCYGPDVSASLIRDLLVNDLADKAFVVASVLLQQDSSLQRVLSLLEECNQGSKHSDLFEPLVRKLIKLFVSLVPAGECRELLKPLLVGAQATRQQRFANVVASAFLSDSSRTSLESVLGAVALVASVPNAISSFVVAPVVLSVQAALKQPGVSLQVVLNALFALESVHKSGWSSWAEERNALLQLLIDWSAETKAQYERMQAFRKVSLVFARMEAAK